MYETGIMGGNALAIINSFEGEKAVPGDFIKSEVQPGLITSLKDNFSGLSTNLDKTLRSADTLMTSLNDVIQDKSDKGLKATVAEFLIHTIAEHYAKQEEACQTINEPSN